MSARGQKRRFDDVRVMSAFPLMATEPQTSRHVSNVPLPDSCTAKKDLLDQLALVTIERS
jgi:hypothetical protein